MCFHSYEAFLSSFGLHDRIPVAFTTTLEETPFQETEQHYYT